MKKIFLICLLIFIAVALLESGTNDTLFLCHFNNTLKDSIKRIEPQQTKEVTFAEGMANTEGILVKKDSVLAYPTAGAFRIEEGTVSLWIQPMGWNGSLDVEPGKSDRIIFRVLPKSWGKQWNANGFALAKNMYGTHFHISDKAGVPFQVVGFGQDFFQDKKWVFLAAAWKLKTNEMYVYVDGELKGRRVNGEKPVIDFDLADTGSEFFLGTNLESVVDELRISGVMESAEEIKALYRKSLKNYQDENP